MKLPSWARMAAGRTARARRCLNMLINESGLSDHTRVYIDFIPEIRYFA